MHRPRRRGIGLWRYSNKPVRAEGSTSKDHFSRTPRRSHSIIALGALTMYCQIQFSFSRSYYFKARAPAQGPCVTLIKPENGTEDRRNVDEDLGVYPGRWKRTLEGITNYLISVVISPVTLLQWSLPWKMEEDLGGNNQLFNWCGYCPTEVRKPVDTLDTLSNRRGYSRK